MVVELLCVRAVAGWGAEESRVVTAIEAEHLINKHPGCFVAIE